MNSHLVHMLHSQCLGAGMNQSDLAAALTAGGFNVTRAAVSKWMTGQSCPSREALAALSDVLSLGVGDRAELYSAAGYYVSIQPMALP